MSTAKWIGLFVTIIMAIGIALNTQPFGWAHDAATGISAFVGALNLTATGYFFNQARKGNS